MKLPDSAHTSRPWRIHRLAPDFRLYDVWALPTPGGPDDFPRLVRQVTRGDIADSPSPIARLLFEIRWKLGALLGWDSPDAGVGARVASLRDRLPADLRDRPAGPDSAHLPFSSVYLTDDEWAVEVANKTVHGVLHLGWVPDDAGGYRGQLAILVKPNGVLGTAYLAAIGPFRHLVVYPALIRGIEQRWYADDPAGHTYAEPRSETAERVVAAPPAAVFALLTDPRRHRELDGSGTLRGDVVGPGRLGLGDRFTMSMHQGLPYRTTNTVVEYESDRLITWETWVEAGGVRLIGGQRWRYRLEPADGGTHVTHSYLWGHSRVAPTLPALGYPRRMRATMPATLDRLARALDGPA